MLIKAKIEKRGAGRVSPTAKLERKGCLKIAKTTSESLLSQTKQYVDFNFFAFVAGSPFEQAGPKTKNNTSGPRLLRLFSFAEGAYGILRFCCGVGYLKCIKRGRV